MSDHIFHEQTGNPDRAYVNLMLRRVIALFEAREYQQLCSCAASDILMRRPAEIGICAHSAVLHYMYTSRALHQFAPHHDQSVRLRALFDHLTPINGCLFDTSSPLSEVQEFLWRYFPRRVDPVFLALAIREFLTLLKKTHEATERRHRALTGGSVLAEVIVAAAMASLSGNPEPQPMDADQEPWIGAYRALSKAPMLPPLKDGLWEVSARATASAPCHAESIVDVLGSTDRLREIVTLIVDRRINDGTEKVVIGEMTRLANAATDLREALQDSPASRVPVPISWLFEPESLGQRLSQIDGFSVEETEFGPRVSFEEN